MNKNAFTLVEILIVVLVIGILAAIAVPQYQISVAKSEYSTLKMETKAIGQAVNSYRMATGNLPRSFSELDISVPVLRESNGASAVYSPLANLKNGETCFINNVGHQTACFLANDKMRFYFNYDTLKPEYCFSISYPTGDKVCEQETGDTHPYTDDCGRPCKRYSY